MWIEEQTPETLATILKESPSCYMVSLLDGEILWANQAMLAWSGYVLSEIMRIGWKRMSVDGPDLAADIDAAEQMRRGEIREYVVEKQYIPKSGKPEWGILSVTRYPFSGDFQFALCHWSPLKNGAVQALTVAMDKCDKIREQMEIMAQHISSLTAKTDEEKWITSSIQMCMKHPKLVLSLVFMGASILGANNVIELLQRLGLANPPQVEMKMKPGEDVSQVKPIINEYLVEY